MNEASAWYYISKVTLNEAWSEFKGTLGGTLLLGFFTLLFLGIPTAIVYFIGADSLVSEGSSKLNEFLKSIPWWLTVPAIISVFFWFARGQKIQIPKLDFKLWLIIALVQFVTFAGFAFLPWWIMLPAYYVISSPLLYLDRLIEIGRHKVQQETDLKGANNEY